MHQEAPDPTELFDLVKKLDYQAGWVFTLRPDYDRGQGSVGLTLEIALTCADSYHPERRRTVDHLFIVPAAAYDRRSWRRWLFERIMDVHLHEAMENFKIVTMGDYTMKDGTRNDRITERPFAPSHGPGNDPYLLREYGTDLDRRTAFTGRVNPD